MAVAEEDPGLGILLFGCCLSGDDDGCTDVWSLLWLVPALQVAAGGGCAASRGAGEPRVLVTRFFRGSSSIAMSFSGKLPTTSYIFSPTWHRKKSLNSFIFRMEKNPVEFLPKRFEFLS